MDLITKRIKRNKTNVEAVARDMGVSRSTIERMMSGQSRPSVDLLTSMVRSVNCRDTWQHSPIRGGDESAT